MRTLSKAAALLRVAELTEQTDVLTLALSDVLAGKGKWFRKGGVQLGLFRPDGGAGGIIIHRWKPESKAPFETLGAYYWEAWYAKTRELQPRDSEDREAHDLRDCAEQVRQFFHALAEVRRKTRFGTVEPTPAP